RGSLGAPRRRTPARDAPTGPLISDRFAVRSSGSPALGRRPYGPVGAGSDAQRPTSAAWRVEAGSDAQRPTSADGAGGASALGEPPDLGLPEGHQGGPGRPVELWGSAASRAGWVARPGA
ncbi:MAG: hypothetical protein ACRDVP_04185, partial [Acidimicrobiales bacterium]